MQRLGWEQLGALDTSGMQFYQTGVHVASGCAGDGGLRAFQFAGPEKRVFASGIPIRVCSVCTNRVQSRFYAGQVLCDRSEQRVGQPMFNLGRNLVP